MSINDVNGNLHSNSDGRFTEESGTRPVGALTPAPESVPVLPGAIAGYQVKNYHASRAWPESGTFTAEVYRDGKLVFRVENEGRGRRNIYGSCSAESYPMYRAEVARFERVAAAGLGEEASDPGDAFVSLLNSAARIDRDTTRRGDERAAHVEKLIAKARQSQHPMTEAEVALLREPGTRFDAE